MSRMDGDGGGSMPEDLLLYSLSALICNQRLNSFRWPPSTARSDYRIIQPPPTTRSSWLNTHAWPGVIARCGRRSFTRAPPPGHGVTGAALPGWLERVLG